MNLNKKEFRSKNQKDNDAMFDFVWRKMRKFERECPIDDPQALYDSLVTDAVNDSNSRFYIYG